MSSGKIEFIDLKRQYAALKDQIAQRMQRVLDHGQYIMGPEVKELEEKLAAQTGAAHCITVASGTEALLISLMALGIKPGDEVITTPFTFAATAEMIVLIGGVPARRIGWMSRNGERLNFNADGAATCPVTGDQYRLTGERVELL